MAEHDQELLDKLNEYAQVTQGDRDALVEAQKQVADSQKAIEAAQNELKDLYAENEALRIQLAVPAGGRSGSNCGERNRGRRPAGAAPAAD